MREIDQYIKQLLFEHECVIMPGFGAFITRDYDAEINSATYMMRPPGKRIAFNRQINENDGLLANLISQTEGVSYEKAMELIQSTSRQWKRVIIAGKRLLLPGIGRLFLGEDESIQFKPVIEINYDKAYYGLPIFRSTAGQREAAIKTSIHKAIEKHVQKKPGTKRKSPVRWAAILGPAIAVTMMGSIYYSSFGDYYNFAGFDPLGIKSLFTTEQVSEREVPEIVPKQTVKKETPIVDSSNDKVEEKEVTELTGVEKETPIPVVKEEVTSTAFEGPAFYIIVGSFKSAQNADNYVKHLASKGYDALIAPGNADFFRVSIGKYESRLASTQMLTSVQKDINPGSWVYHN